MQSLWREKVLRELFSRFNSLRGQLPCFGRVTVHTITGDGKISERPHRMLSGAIYALPEEPGGKIIILNPVIDGVQCLSIIVDSALAPGSHVVTDVSLAPNVRKHLDEIVGEYRAGKAKSIFI